MVIVKFGDDRLARQHKATGNVVVWLIERFTDGTVGGRILIPALLRQALVRWYCGDGDRLDEEAGIVLVQQARIGGKWLACDCRAASELPPILTPAYLSDAETYYLRRLTGPDRPAHRDDCPFFRDQATATMIDSVCGRWPAAPPDSFFQILRPSPEKLAQCPPAVAVDGRARHPSLPMLARLLRKLLLVSGRTVVPAGAGAGAISDEFRAVRRAAERLEVAPGVALGRVLWTHASAFETQRVFASLRELERAWPSGHAPQGFLLLFSREFHAHLVHPAEGDAIHIANRVQSPARYDRSIRPPYLVLIVIGRFPEAQRLAPLGAYAQPVFSGRRFVPLDDDYERSLLTCLLQTRPMLRSQGISISIEKPVFDQITPAGECRPRFILNVAYDGFRPCRRVVLAAPQDTDKARVASVGTVLEIAEGSDPIAIAEAIMRTV